MSITQKALVVEDSADDTELLLHELRSGYYPPRDRLVNRACELLVGSRGYAHG